MSPQNKSQNQGSLYDKESYKPLFFRLYNREEKSAWQELLDNTPHIKICDEILVQLQELHKLQHPSKELNQNDYNRLNNEYIAGRDLNEVGVWVYYPWSALMIHVLEKEDFITVRTNRNYYKITPEEGRLLNKKIVGVVGLSVGQSVALALAMERSFGELRLADFDHIELSNLNRIRTPLYNMGVKKAVVVAREISEIDPYLSVKVFLDGLTEENMDAFFIEGGKMDLLMEECDSLDMKIKGRLKAKSLQIPVVMDTSDRGMIDVERFDLDPERPIFHGLVEGMDINNLSSLSNQEKIPYILKMIGGDDISPRLKASIYEVKQTISTWPQLATSVIMGGAIAADVGRRILLDSFRESGRYYVDVNKIFSNRSEALIAVDNRKKSEGNTIDKTIAKWNRIYGKDWCWSGDKETLHLKKGVREENNLLLADLVNTNFSKGVVIEKMKFDLQQQNCHLVHASVNDIDKTINMSFSLHKGLTGNTTTNSILERKDISSAIEGFQQLKTIFPIKLSSLKSEEKINIFQKLVGDMERLMLLSEKFYNSFVGVLKNSSLPENQRWLHLFADRSLMSTFTNNDSGNVLRERVGLSLKACKEVILISTSEKATLDETSFGAEVEKLNSCLRTKGLELKGMHALPTIFRNHEENASSFNDLFSKTNQLFDLSATDKKYFLFTVFEIQNDQPNDETGIHNILL